MKILFLIACLIFPLSSEASESAVADCAQVLTQKDSPTQKLLTHLAEENEFSADQSKQLTDLIKSYQSLLLAESSFSTPIEEKIKKLLHEIGIDSDKTSHLLETAKLELIVFNQKDISDPTLVTLYFAVPARR